MGPLKKEKAYETSAIASIIKSLPSSCFSLINVITETFLEMLQLLGKAIEVLYGQLTRFKFD